MDEKLKPAKTKSGRARTRHRRKAANENPEALRAESPSLATSGSPTQGSSNNSRNGARKSSKRKAASSPRAPRDKSSHTRAGARRSSARKSPSASGAPQVSPADVRGIPGKLPAHQGASAPRPGSSSSHVQAGTRLWPGRKSAAALLSMVGLISLLAMVSVYRGHLGEHETTVADCDNGSCGSPAAVVPVVDSNAPAAAVADNKPAEVPMVGPVQKRDKHRPSASHAKANAAGIVVSGKTGARARVAVAYAARFQAYIDDLETNHGARVAFIGGIRPGRCATSSLHPCGRALDVCQLRRGVVDARCRLPPRRQLAQIAASHGLFEGGRWCDSDYGHVQLGDTAGDCGARRAHFVRRRFLSEAGREAFASFR